MTDEHQIRSPHNPALQSLRGLAATLVMVHHALRTIVPSGWTWDASEFLLNAHGAVVVFFVLSGYVLSASLFRRGVDAQGTAVFYVRRVFRIYPALWIGLVLGTVYYIWIAPLQTAHLSAWANTDHYQPGALTFSEAVQSVFGLQGFLLPTSWTITVELCASLVLPFLVIILIRVPRSTIPIIIGLALVAWVAGPAARQVPFFMVDFALGASLACWAPAQKWRPPGWAMIVALIVLLFAHVVLVPEQDHMVAISLIEGLASTIIVAGIARRPMAWLKRPTLVAVGDWSYSIYLLHLPIAFAIARLIDHAGWISGDLNFWALAIALLTCAVVIPLSMLTYRYVELPGIRLGNHIAGRWRSPRVPKPVSVEPVPIGGAE